MSAVTVLAAEGIGAQLNKGLLEAVRREAPKASWEYFVYPNNYGPVGTADPARGAAYDDIRKEQVPRLVDKILSTPGPLVLYGYSAGAHLMGDAVLQVSRKYAGTTKAKIARVVLVADPAAPMNTGFMGRCGIAGARDIPLLRTLQRIEWLSNSVDVIPCCPIPSSWRTFYDITGGYSLLDPRKWSAGLIAKATAKAFQPGGGNIRETISLGRGYLYDGQHSSWYLPALKIEGQRLRLMAEGR